MGFKPLTITHLDVNGMRRPVGIDDSHPTFHYVCGGEGTNRAVTAHRVLVTSSAGEWDSGRLPAPSPYISYAGPALKPKTTYTASVQVWDEEQAPSALSAPVTFETGFLGTGWQARWIEPVQENAHREADIGFFGMLEPDESFFNGQTRLREAKELERRFTAGLPARARLYATAHGVYELSLNGKKVSDFRLAPETSNYNKMLWYQTYDVLPLLREGENTLRVLLGDGWWIGRLGMAGDSCNYGDRLGFLMQLELIYPDGRVETVCSDEHFRCRGSQIRYSDLFIGEKLDRTFRPGEWEPCAVADGDKSVLTGQPVDPMRVIGEMPVKRVLQTPAGELVLDFGQVLSGVVRLALDAPEGTEIVLDHGEVLDKDGSFKSNIKGRNKNQRDILISAGGRQIFEPKFTYHGFRYARVRGLKEEQILSARALVIGTPVRKTGSFETDNPLLNQLQHNIEWSALSNMMSVPTDCPQREKLGWTGDISIFAPTGAYLYDLRSFLNGWLKQLRADQYENGQVPVVVPNHPGQELLQIGMSGENSSSVWGDACILVPLALYRMYGDKRVLQENFETMRRWVNFIGTVAARREEGFESLTPERQARNPYLWTKGFHFGDWLIPSLRDRPDGVMAGMEKTGKIVGACDYALNVAAMAEVCRALGKETQAEEYTALLGKIRRAVREEFVAEDGRVGDGSLQGLYVMVLAGGVCEGPLKEKVLDRLVGLIRTNGGCLDTGFSSVSHLLDVLYDNGRREAAFELLYQEKAPSWLYMVKMGATSIWENWKAVLPDGTATDSSYNHYAFGCVGGWMYRRMGGLIPLEPGFKRVKVAPDYSCGLGGCKTSYQSPYGEIACSWSVKDGAVTLKVRIPVGVTAQVEAGGEIKNIGSGEHTFITEKHEMSGAKGNARHAGVRKAHEDI